MGVSNPIQHLMGDIQLNPTDKAIIELLREGRCTPPYIAETYDYSRQNVTNQLNRLVDHGYIEKIHTGLYELVDDPSAEMTNLISDI
jgi:DNA-binding MarR family transcriptional regulator